MNIDRYFKKRYDENEYNCAHFVSELWEDLTGRNLQKELAGFLLPPNLRTVPANIFEMFVRTDKPKNPSIVLMRGKLEQTHVGIYLNSKVLHFTENGLFHQRLEMLNAKYENIGFYTC